jgi:hypothetical protein
VPLHTLRADIDYGTAEAHTAYGIIGVKVWIFKGEIWNMIRWRLNARDRLKAAVNQAVIAAAPAIGAASAQLKRCLAARRQERRDRTCCSRSAPSSASSTRAASRQCEGRH